MPGTDSQKTMILHDPLPEPYRTQYRRLCGHDDGPAYCCRADIAASGLSAHAFVAVDTQRVVAFDPGAQPVQVPLKDLEDITVSEMFGHSQLVATTAVGRVPLARYSRNLVGEFAALCRVIDELRTGGEPLLPEDHARATCATCSAPLPERGGRCPLCMSRTTVMRRLWTILRPYKKQALLLVSCSCISVFCAMIPPLTYKMIADRVLADGHHDELILWVGIMLAAFLAENGFRFVTNWINVWLSPRVIADMRSRLHAHVQRLQMRYHDRHESGELVGRVMHDTGELQHFMTDGLPYFLVNGISFVAIATILLSLDWRLAGLVFMPVPVLLVGGRFFWSRLRPMFNKHGQRIGALHTRLGESLQGVRTVKSMAQESRRTTEFDQTNEHLWTVDVRLSRTFLGFFASMSLTMAMGTILVWYFGGRAITQHDAGAGRPLQLGTLLAFVGYMALFYGPLQWFSAVYNWMNNALTAAERIFAVLDQPSEVYTSDQAVTLARARGGIAFERVRFSYERGSEVIKGIDLTIEPGTMIGLVGRSGAGKSTLINLICRFYDPDSGTITIDGHDLRTIDLENWRQQVGIVMQDPFLFNASLLENIRYGKPAAPLEEVVDAARAALAHEFICAKEEGYDSLVGESGVALSGGEKQRIAIARAILHDPPVLILDEATSAVDSETEKQIQEAIANLVQGRTTIAIAHRLATLRNADRLVVVDDGRIVEQGTHEELMSHEDGHFSKLVRLQADINRIRAEQDVWQQ